MTDETLELHPEDVRLVLAMANVAHKHPDAHVYVGGAARYTAAKRAKDRVRRTLAQYDQENHDQRP